MKSKILLLVSILFFSVSYVTADEYEVVRILERLEVEEGTKSIDDWGNIEKVQYILSPAKLDAGTYNVTITRKDSNIYKIENSDLYIETKYCYEYCTRKDVILVIKDYGYRNVGTMIILD